MHQLQLLSQWGEEYWIFTNWVEMKSGNYHCVWGSNEALTDLTATVFRHFYLWLGGLGLT